MPTTEDDILDSPVPAPDAEATPSERAHAKTFADIIDKTIAGKTPPAMSADDRALVEVATVIRAGRQVAQMELPAAKQRSIVEDALRQAVGGASATSTLGGPTPIGSARKKRWVPWAISAVSTAVAAAAVLVLWLRTPKHEIVREPAETPVSWTSRPADPLIGPIAREQAGAASSRIDYIFADRLDGFRERRLSPRGGTP
jgi:hypothetical protein